MSRVERSVRRRATACLLAAAAAATYAAGQAAAGAPARVALPSSIPGSIAGTAPTTPDSGLVIPLRVYLAGDATARVRETLAVSDPRNPAYAHYLTPSQYEHAYGPSAAQISTVKSWLTAQGMTVTATNQHYIGVESTVARADKAFDTHLALYAGTLAPTGGASVPASLAGDIATVTGLYDDAPGAGANASRRAARATAVPSKSTSPGGASQCSMWWSQHTTSIPAAYGRTTAPTITCGYTVKQMRQAYGVTSSPYTGGGATVAVVLNGRLPSMRADANRFFASQGVAGFAPGQYSEVVDSRVDGSCGGGDVPEEPLDVETAHMAAPDAKVVYVGTDCEQSAGLQQQDFLDAMTRVDDRHLADVVTESFAVTEQVFTPAIAAAWELTFQQGAIEGIGFDFDSGDFGDGSGGAGPAFVQYPASDPWATAVGGTSLEIGANGNAIGEYGWGDNAAQLDAAGTGYTAPPPGVFQGGSTGGVTALGFAEPAYQRGVVPAALATSGGTRPARRVLPDVSADAGLLWLIGFTDADAPGVYAEMAQGGTSGAAPLIAGLEADAKQAAGHAVGFANPALYRLAGTPAIHDVLPVDPRHPPVMAGSSPNLGAGAFLVTLGEDSSLTAARGYDDVTGVGSPGRGFVTAFRNACR